MSTLIGSFVDIASMGRDAETPYDELLPPLQDVRRRAVSRVSRLRRSQQTLADTKRGIQEAIFTLGDALSQSCLIDVRHTGDANAALLFSILATCGVGMRDRTPSDRLYDLRILDFVASVVGYGRMGAVAGAIMDSPLIRQDDAPGDAADFFEWAREARGGAVHSEWLSADARCAVDQYASGDGVSQIAEQLDVSHAKAASMLARAMLRIWHRASALHT